MTDGVQLFMEKNPNFKFLKQERLERGLKLYNKKTNRTDDEMKKHIAQLKLQWQRDNREYFNQLCQLNYYRNRDKILAKNKEKVECEYCKKMYAYASLWGHKKKYCKAIER
jgi:hypothetical protein